MRHFGGVWGIAALAGAVSLAGSAAAETVVAKLTGTSPATTMTITLGATTFTNVPGGRQNWVRTGGDFAELQGTFATYCIEIPEQALPNFTYAFDVDALENAPDSMGGMGIGKASLMAELYGRFFDGLNQASAQEQGAFQLAIWEIVYDDGVNLATGDFHAVNSGAFYGLAAAMLGALDGSGPTKQIGALVAEGVQDQVFIPEPSSLALLAAGTLLLRRK